MKKLTLIVALTSLSAVSYAQPRCFLVGPSFSMGSSSISNYTFTRTSTTTSESTPVNTFSNFGNAKAKAKSAGIFMDI
jgi:hypothetical protein